MAGTGEKGAWRAVFLRGLRAGKSASAAAGAAGVHPQTPFNTRRADTGFAADWAAARGEGLARLGGEDLPRLAGDEIVCRSKTGPCVMKAAPGRWSAERERVFLDALAATGNVRRSAAAAAVSCPAVYKRRRDEAGFAERWRDALEQGWARIEAALIHAAAATLEGLPPEDGDEAIPPRLTVAEAMGVFRDHQRATAGLPARRPGPRPKEPSIEQVRAEVIRRIAVLDGKAAR